MIDALPLLLGPEGYQISRSVRLRSSASAYFNRTPASAGNRQKWTYRVMLKRGAVASQSSLISARTDDNNRDVFQFQADATLQLVNVVGGSATTNLVTSAVYRDPSSFYDILLAVDTTQATASNRVKLYVNGVQVTAFSTATYPAQNANFMINAAVAHGIGRFEFSSPGGYYDGLFTEMYLIDGQQLDPSSFGETNPVTGVWQPKKYAGTYGTNGFFLNFSDNSAATAATIGKDYSGNGNNWTPNNISVTAGVTYDSMLDVPTQWADGGNGRGNYATWSPIDHPTTFIAPTNGNLSQNCNTAAWTLCVPTFAIPDGSGLWQWELIQTGTANGANAIGVCLTTVQASVTGAPSSRAGCSGVDNVGTTFINGATSGSITYPTVGNTITCLYDATNRTFQVFDNGTSKGTITGLPAGDVRPFVAASSSNGSPTFVANFGQTTFAYNKGGKALNTLNLPTPTILKGNQYFDATLWDGNSTNARVITTNVGTVDFAWVKKRNGADDHRLANTVTGGNRHLQSNTTAAESTGTTIIQAFSGSTFTLGTDGSVNATGGTYVGWTWAEGATQGFDIVTYTGNGTSQNISHSLGVAPRMMIVKKRSTTGNWPVYHASLGNATSPFLNLTNAANSQPNLWNSTTPTSSVFTVGSDGETNANTATYVAYLFAEVAGFSKFGSYTGNGSADGPFVFCGFRPRFVLFKRTDSATGGEWAIYDSSRDPYNACTTELYPSNNLADTTAGGASMDIVSNGFKIRNSRLGINASGGTYIFAAFSEFPFKNSLAR